MTDSKTHTVYGVKKVVPGQTRNTDMQAESLHEVWGIFSPSGASYHFQDHWRLHLFAKNARDAEEKARKMSPVEIRFYRGVFARSQLGLP